MVEETGPTERQDGAGEASAARAEIRSILTELIRERGSPRDRTPQNLWERFTQFTSSGLFFMIVGALFLLAAAWTMNSQHAAFTFVMVVVGVAVLLFGTGTQGVGQAEAPGYRVAIAGGAGLIAFCVGWGIIKFADDIKTVFQIERKYVRVNLEGLEGADYVGNYVAAITLNGMGIPVARHPDSIEVFIPYTARDWVKSKQGAFVESTENSFANCQRVEPASATADKEEAFIVKTFRATVFPIAERKELRSKFSEYVTLRLRKSAVLEAGGDGADFPVYGQRVCVTLISSDNTRTIKKHAVENSDTTSAVRPRDPRVQAPQAGDAPLLPPEAEQ